MYSPQYQQSFHWQGLVDLVVELSCVGFSGVRQHAGTPVSDTAMLAAAQSDRGEFPWPTAGKESVPGIL